MSKQISATAEYSTCNVAPSDKQSDLVFYTLECLQKVAVWAGGLYYSTYILYIYFRRNAYSKYGCYDMWWHSLIDQVFYECISTYMHKYCRLLCMLQGPNEVDIRITYSSYCHTVILYLVAKMIHTVYRWWEAETFLRKSESISSFFHCYSIQHFIQSRHHTTSSTSAYSSPKWTAFFLAAQHDGLFISHLQSELRGRKLLLAWQPRWVGNSSSPILLHHVCCAPSLPLQVAG